MSGAIKKIRRRIETAAQAGGRPRRNVFSGLVQGASGAYKMAVRLQGACYAAGILPVRRLPCRVISIGNITAGGTGKTPMTIYTAQLMQQMGYRPVVLSRGYRGALEKRGGVVSDGYRLFADPRLAGDEPFMMACRLGGVPVLVGKDRFASGMRAVADFDPDVILLDDGFQHRRLHRDLDLVLVDAKTGFGNGRMLPAGVLREPVGALCRAHAVIVTRSLQNAGRIEIPGIPAGIPVFCAEHAPYVAGVYSGSDGRALEMGAPGLSEEFGFLRGRRVYAFSGIARNGEFRAVLEQRIGPLAGFKAYADHYFYTDADLAGIAGAANACSADYLATTEKDFVRVAGRFAADVRIVVVGVRIVLQDPDASRLTRFLRRKLGEQE